MTEAKFKAITNIDPDHCATCKRGERYAEIELVSYQEIVRQLELLGFITPIKGAQINCFFVKGRLYLIRIGEFDQSLNDARVRFEKDHGAAKKISSAANHEELRWRDKQTELRVSATGGRHIDIIIVDVNLRRTIEK